MTSPYNGPYVPANGEKIIRNPVSNNSALIWILNMYQVHFFPSKINVNYISFLSAEIPYHSNSNNLSPNLMLIHFDPTCKCWGKDGFWCCRPDSRTGASSRSHRNPTNIIHIRKEMNIILTITYLCHDW